jgi:D-alanyl-D-alanine endopeptidase (penicillin-binding protein 7)
MRDDAHRPNIAAFGLSQRAKGESSMRQSGWAVMRRVRNALGSQVVFAGVLVALLLSAGSAAALAAGKSSAARKVSATGTTATTRATSKGPDVRSNAAFVMDTTNGKVVFERKSDLVAPIASITKLMTALVVLEAQQPLDETLEIAKADGWKGKGSFSRLTVGTKLSRGDLLHLALMASENRAARALGRNYPGGEPAFVRAMNAKAKALGMTQSHFDDPSGLSTENVSSARDLAKLVIAASRNAKIREYSTSPSHQVKVGRSMLEFRNTNSLVKNPAWEISVQKTGFINEAGECLVMQTMIEERPVVIVLLNSFGKLTRVADAKRIRNWMESQHARSLARTEERKRS